MDYSCIFQNIIVLCICCYNYMFYHLFCDLNILWTIWSLNFACLNLKRILFREKRQIITLNRENKYPQWVLLFERRQWKKNWPKSDYQYVKAISKFEEAGGGKRGFIFWGLNFTHQVFARYLAALQVLGHWQHFV